MNEESEIIYKEGDIVWVKISNCWWPGEVKDESNVPPDALNFKKPPLAVVQFFNEDAYEFVKTYNNIYPYNSERKNDFIRRGMDLFRANNPHMEKFPIDVSEAEVRTNGNPNILSDPIFAPQKKSNIVAEVFGSPKKNAKELKNKKRNSAGRPSHKKAYVTHRRFLGHDDYEAKIRIQYPGKDCENSDEEEIKNLNVDKDQQYSCSLCSFKTIRQEVMLFHVNCHIKGVCLRTNKKSGKTTSKIKRSPKKIKKQRLEKVQSLDTESDDEELEKKKRKKPKKTMTKAAKLVEPSKPATDIHTDILAEWDDDDNEDFDSTLNTSDEHINSSKFDDSFKEDDDKKNKSCFDFQEDEDNDSLDLNISKKVSRTSSTTPRKSVDSKDISTGLEEEESLKESNDIVHENESTNVSESSSKETDEEFNSLLKSTSVPELPEVPSTLKLTKNSPISNTVKIPDKEKSNNTEIATKLTNPKKRFVKSFEDFELQQNEQKRIAMESEQSDSNKSESPQDKSEVIEDENEKIEISKLKCQLMSKISVEETKDFKSSKDEVKHKSPRSKILDSFKTSKRRMSGTKKSSDDETTEKTDKQKDECAPKKAKYLKYDHTEETKGETSTTEDNVVQKIDDEESSNLDESVTTEKTVTLDQFSIDTEVHFESEQNSLQKPENNEIPSEVEVNSITEKSDTVVQINDKADDLIENVVSEDDLFKKVTNLLETDETNEKTLDENNPEDMSNEKNLNKPTVEDFPDETLDNSLSEEILNKKNNETSVLLNILQDDSNTSDFYKDTESDALKDKPSEIQSETLQIKENDSDKPIEENILHETKSEVANNSTEDFSDDTKVSSEFEDLEPISNKITDEETQLSSNTLDILMDDNVPMPESSKAQTPETIPDKVNNTNVENKNQEKDVDEVEKDNLNVKEKIDDNVTEVELKNGEKKENDKNPKKDLVENMDASKTPEKPLTPPGELHIKYDSHNKESTIDFNIKTNLSNMSSQEEMSALTTLATMSELKTNIETIQQKPENESDTTTPLVDFKSAPQPPESELITIDGNLTVVSEKDLADGQVEITTNLSDNNKKPVTLTNFSLDYAESNSDSNSGFNIQLPDVEKHQPESIKTEKNSGNKNINKIEDMEDLIPQQIICSQEKEKSKLMEKLTENVKKLPEKPKVSVVTKKIIRTPILTEKVVLPEKPTVSVQKINKQNMFDADDVDTFIIQKGTIQDDSNTPLAAKKKGKAKILQQTIITAAGEIIQPTVQEDNVFDINSMPIVLSDQILTPENIESMPIYLSDTVTTDAGNKIKKVTQKVINQPLQQQQQLITQTPEKKVMKTKLIGTKIVKSNSISTPPLSKTGKYVIVTQPQSAPTKTITTTKKTSIIKNTPLKSESTGNKIMILTNQQGQKQRVLLTPAQQKMIGMQAQGRIKTIVKSPMTQKTIVQQSTQQQHLQSQPGSSKIQSTITGKNLIINSKQVLYDQKPKIDLNNPIRKKVQISGQKIIKPAQKTILIKNQLGQTVRRIQGTDDALLDQQVQEQLEAIKASSLKKQQMLQQQQQQQQQTNTESKSIGVAKPIKKQINKKFTIENKPKPKQQQQHLEPVPPLAPISPKKSESQMIVDKDEPKSDRPLNQLVIQDAMGNQTTITEGQILALPSETVDGQPQSYMLVTLDESGNLTPLNNEALMSLDPNLGLGGDIANLQISTNETLQIQTPEEKKEPPKVEAPPPQPTPTPLPAQQPQHSPPQQQQQQQEQQQQQQISCTVTEGGQQLIVTGDPIVTQKFLESLTEGSTDLANILANAEGSTLLIQADGQQIFINTDSDNQMLLSVNTDNERSESCGNPIFAPQPKNQDILAAALADTDVFQQEQTNQNKQLSPNSTLYPMNVGNVLETSLTLNSPIMTPLEVPSTNNKKIADENDILTQVPTKVDLPITITDPNISHTVNQQQVATLMAANELLPETTISNEINSSNFVYSLPNLDENLEKPFNSSMPLLNEEDDNKQKRNEKFLEENEGLCTLGGEICSSLSEPPPDMFDLADVLNSKHKDDNISSKSSTNSDKLDTAPESNTTSISSPNQINEDSCEIPVQTSIVTDITKDFDLNKDDDKLD